MTISKSNRRPGTFHIITSAPLLVVAAANSLTDTSVLLPVHPSHTPHLFCTRVATFVERSWWIPELFRVERQKKKKLGKNRKEKVTEWKNIISMQLVRNPIDFYSFPWDDDVIPFGFSFFRFDSVQRPAAKAPKNPSNGRFPFVLSYTTNLFDRPTRMYLNIITLTSKGARPQPQFLVPAASHRPCSHWQDNEVNHVSSAADCL